MEKNRAFECVLGFTLVQFPGSTAALIGLLDPVEREQRAFDASDFPKRQSQAVGSGVGTEALEHDRCADHAGAD